MNKLIHVKVMESYRKQIADMAPYINISKLSKDIGVSKTALWRYFREITDGQKINLEVVQKLEEIGLLVAPVIIS